MIMIADYIANHIEFLEQGEQPLDVKLERILQHEYRRKFARYQYTDRILRQKYQMDFKTFRQQKIVAEQDYSFEVENDASDWEMALDGVVTMARKLKELQESPHVH